MRDRGVKLVEVQLMVNSTITVSDVVVADGLSP